MRILIDVIPAGVRRYVYAAWALAGLVLGCLAVAGVDTGALPEVYAFATTALGLTAYANTHPEVGWEKLDSDQ